MYNIMPCNANFPALRHILKNANKDEKFNVRYSGKAKGTCPGEDFGIIAGSTVFYYIESGFQPLESALVGSLFFC